MHEPEKKYGVLVELYSILTIWKNLDQDIELNIRTHTFIYFMFVLSFESKNKLSFLMLVCEIISNILVWL